MLDNKIRNEAAKTMNSMLTADLLSSRAYEADLESYLSTLFITNEAVTLAKMDVFYDDTDGLLKMTPLVDPLLWD